MSRATFFHDETGTLSSLWRFALIVTIFLVAWPPLAGMAMVWLGFNNLEPTLGWLTLAAIYSYLFCVPSALLAGIVTAGAAIGFRHNSVLIPVLTALLSSVVLPALAMQIPLNGPPPSLQHLPVFVVHAFPFVFFGSLIASIICWRMTRRFARVA